MRRVLLTVVAGVLLGVGLSAQSALSNQVLQLLTRPNTWTATNTFLDLRLIAGVPSDTALRLYVDNAGNLYFNGNVVAGSTGGAPLHNLLSSTHPDTLQSAPQRGSVIVGNATPQWAALAVCPAGSYVGGNGIDTLCQTTAAGFTFVPAGQLTGTASAFNGAAITALSAGNLLGTVPLASLAGITTTQIAAGAGIVRSQLALAAGIALTTDVTGVLPLANGGTGLSTAWIAQAIPNCADGTHALAFTTATSLFSCQALATGGGGAVSSVGLTMPPGFTVTGSPVTGSGTLAVTATSELANVVWAGPNSGAAASPTFRSLVNADFPVSGATAGSYPKVTVNAQGIVTAGSATIAAATDVTGTLPRVNGGTGVAVSGNNTVLVGNGTSWVAQTVTDCQGGTLGFTQSTNLFSCVDALTASAAGVGTLGTTANPYGSAILGTAATNNLSITPGTFVQGTVATVDDPVLAAVKLPLVRRGTISYTAGSLTTGTCSAAQTATVTGLSTTSVVTASLSTTPGTQWQKGIYFLAYPTANTVSIMVCNPTAGSITPDSATFNYAAIVP